MPKITAEQLTPTRVKLTSRITADDLAPFMKQAYRSISKQVSIPGFRKGHVPAPIIDQRVGRQAVIEQAVNDSLDSFYQAALSETDTQAMGRPTADVEQWLDPSDVQSELTLVFEVEARPEFTLPSYEHLKIEVDTADIDDDAVEKKLTELRERFGTLHTVDRPAETGSFVELDLVARIGAKEVDRTSGVSYELGSGSMLDGLDEALDTLTAGESTTFTSQLLGGDYEGQEAEVEVTVTAVKERTLAEADDDFAQLASEFDTIAELRESLAEQVSTQAVFAQGAQARDRLVDTLIEQAQIPISEELVEEQVQRHLENEGKLEDDEHRTEVRQSAERQLAFQLLFDAIAKTEQITPTQGELSQYLVQSAQQYGMEPTQFLQVLSQSNQMPSLVSDVTRNKALAVALSKARVVDTNGDPVDLSEFAAVDTEEPAAAENPTAAEAEAEQTDTAE